MIDNFESAFSLINDVQISGMAFFNSKETIPLDIYQAVVVSAACHVWL